MSSYNFTTKKMKFSIKDFFSKCDQMENFIFCAVHIVGLALKG